MDSVQLLAGQVASIDRRTERMERKIDQYIPLASRVPGIESRMDSVDRKADEFLRPSGKWWELWPSLLFLFKWPWRI